MQIDHQLYKKVVNLAYEVKENFREQGYVLPSGASRGRIRIGNYFICKEKSGFYCILDTKNTVLYEKINLAQTAVLVANSLAIRNKDEDKFLEYDREYGFYSFEDENYQRLSKIYLESRDWAKYEALETKQESAQEKAEKFKNYILAHFEKLTRLR